MLSVVDLVDMCLSCKECSCSVYHSRKFQVDTLAMCIPPQLQPQVCVWCDQLDILDRLPVYPWFDMFLGDMVHTFLLLLTVFLTHIHHDIPAKYAQVSIILILYLLQEVIFYCYYVSLT
jgi:hypothetical protein